MVWFNISDTLISDISVVLSFMDLRELTLGSTVVEAIDPAKDLTYLKILRLDGTFVSDISPLENLPNLTE